MYNTVDKFQLSRLHRKLFSRSLLALGVLPTRAEWCFNPKAERYLEYVRVLYEDELAMTYYETKRSTLEDCQDLMRRAARSIVELGHYHSGSRDNQAAGRYDEEGSEEEFWECRLHMLEPTALKESRRRWETGPNTGCVWTWSSPNNYEKKRRRVRVGDWIQEECFQEAPGKPIACLMRYSPAPPPIRLPQVDTSLVTPSLVKGSKRHDRRRKGEKPPGRH